MKPVIERIAESVRKRLGITRGGTSVVRPTRTGGFKPEDYQLVFAQETQTPNEALSCPGNPPLQAWNAPFRIAAELLQSKKDTTAVDTLRNEFAAQVVKALTTSAGPYWAQWGGLAINSQLSAIETFLDEGDQVAGFHIVLTVQYRTPENNPFESAG